MNKNKHTKPWVIGFTDESALVRSLAGALGGRAKFVTPKQYAGGEWTVWCPPGISRRAFIVGSGWEDPVRLFQMMMLMDAARSSGAKKIVWVAPWIAYGRQERSKHRGEPAPGVLVGKMTVAAGADRILTLDAHSPRFIRAFGGRLRNLMPKEHLLAFAEQKKITAVAAPDMGARSRVTPIASARRVPTILIQKDRAVSGRVRSKIRSGSPRGARVLLVDDIADSGGTLFAAADVLRLGGASAVFAYVTHAKDLARLRKDARAHGILAVETAFDHAKKDIRIAPSVFRDA